MFRVFNICTSASQEPANHGIRGHNTIDGHPSPDPSCTTVRSRSLPCLTPAPSHTCRSLGDSHAFLQFFSSQAFRIQSHPLVPWWQLLSCPACCSPQRHTWVPFKAPSARRRCLSPHLSFTPFQLGPGLAWIVLWVSGSQWWKQDLQHRLLAFSPWSWDWEETPGFLPQPPPPRLPPSHLH